MPIPRPAYRIVVFPTGLSILAAYIIVKAASTHNDQTALIVALFTILFGYIFFHSRKRNAWTAKDLRRTEMAEHTLFLASHDTLTRLPNRAHFVDEMSIYLARSFCPNLNLLVLKILNLDEIANVIGRDEADNVVKWIGAKLHTDGLISGAIAKNTFAVISCGAMHHEFVEKIASDLSDMGYAVKPTLSWGVSCFPAHGTCAHELLYKAELALTAGLYSCRNLSVYAPSLEPALDDQQLVQDFAAFGHTSIFPVFGPQLDTHSGRITSAEVLVRWNHPERGLIPPTRFIPLIEEAGLISIVTLRMIDEAVRESVRFRRLGRSCSFSVNISVHDFNESDIPRAFADALAKHGGRARDLVAELTETGSISNLSLIQDSLLQLKDMGIGVSIDDFGTGFSSLASLAQLPFDELKIDQMFTGKIRSSPSYSSVIRSTINMAHELGLGVVAEGAENPDTVQRLIDYGCDRIQGYAISHPLSADDFFRFATAFKWVGNQSSTHHPAVALQLVA